MFLVWKGRRPMSLVTCSPNLAWVCSWFGPKLGSIWSQKYTVSKNLEMMGITRFRKQRWRIQSLFVGASGNISNIHETVIETFRTGHRVYHRQSFFPFAPTKWPETSAQSSRNARTRMGYHVTKLISLHSFSAKNNSSKFNRNLMNQIQDMLKTV